MEPLQIQLAIQGGGAKICGLFAVLEAVQSLQAQKVLRVTRIAGTSAGAIAGCLFAAGIPMETIRERLRSISKDQLSKLFPPVSGPSMVWHLLRGRPFWDTKALRIEMERLFKGRSVETLSDLKIPVFVLATSLGDSQGLVYSVDKPILTALLDSCGIPYWFRTWNSPGSPGIVDGGICENLPSEELASGVSTYGPVVGISFCKHFCQPPDSIVSFTKALLDSAMDNSMDRASRKLEGDLLKIQTEISTFDFAKALSEGLDKEYTLTRKDAEEFFKQLVAKKRSNEADEAARGPWGIDATALMHDLARVYTVQHLPSKFEFLQCKYEVQASCLTDQGEIDFGKPDYSRTQVTFRPLQDPIYCWSVALSESQAMDAKFSGGIRCEVRDRHGAVINTIQVPVRNPQYREERELLVFFDPPLRANGNEPYTIVLQQYIYNLMSRLRNEGQDELSFMPRRAFREVGRIDLVLYLPERYTPKVKPKEGSALGHQMPDNEIARYDVRLGFRRIGWTGERIPADATFAFDISL